NLVVLTSHLAGSKIRPRSCDLFFLFARKGQPVNIGSSRSPCENPKCSNTESGGFYEKNKLVCTVAVDRRNRSCYNQLCCLHRYHPHHRAGSVGNRVPRL